MCETMRDRRLTVW